MPHILIYNDDGVAEFTRNALFNSLLAMGVTAQYVSAHDILEGVLKEQNPDLFIVPGGADEPYMAKLGEEGCLLIRSYVETGGRYLGLCAGAYFASSSFEFNKGLNTEICRDRPLKFFEGKAVGSIQKLAPAYDLTLNTAVVTELELSEAGTAQCYYHGGPYFDTDINVIGRYTQVLVKDEVLAPAILERRIGKGHVVLCSAHPEVRRDDVQRRIKEERENANNPHLYSELLSACENLTTDINPIFRSILDRLLASLLNTSS